MPSLFGQNYLRGVIRDEKNNPLTEVNIKLFSTKQYPYTNGNDGSFGFPSRLNIDTMYLSLDGYEPMTTALYANQFNVIILKLLPDIRAVKKNKLNSKTKDLEIDQSILLENEGESYSALIENNFVNTIKNPETGFALNVDRAAYSNIRRFINNGMVVPIDAVRIEEMLNYFDFKDSINSNKIECKTQITTCPWNSNTNLLFVNTCFPKINLEKIPPSNLVFLIDVSGSMERPNRLPLLKAGFKMLVDNLRDIDKVSIVSYGGGVEVELEPTSGKNKSLIKKAIDALDASGETPGGEAIKTAYSVAKTAFIKNGNNRVILATDGDFNVGQSTEKELEDLIIIQRKNEIYLTCIGVGMGNYKDSKLETLAKKGNGNFAYLDNIQEAEKVLITEFTKTVYAVAKDAYININFNNRLVKNYRLIGYDNKKNAIQDIANTVAGGEVGSGHGALAIFEIEPLKNNHTNDDVLGELNLHYKNINSDSSIQINVSIKNNPIINIDSANFNLRFATGICMFGSILKKSKFVKGYDLFDIGELVSKGLKKENYLHKEFLILLQKAEEIYGISKKNYKKRKKKNKLLIS